ncbi:MULTISPECIES: hypothetical protein [unclassified Bartonella]
MVFINQRNHLRVSPHGALERERWKKHGRACCFFMNKMLVFQAFA